MRAILPLLLCALAAHACSTPRYERARERLQGALSVGTIRVHTRAAAAGLGEGGYAAALGDDSSLTITAASCAAAADALHQLADHAFAYCAPRGALAACLPSHPSFSSGAVRATPAFPSRIYSDQGQLLDAPDRGFYLANGSLNTARVQEDIDTALELIPYLQQHTFTSYMFESSGVEDYLNYDFLGTGQDVYAAGDPHRARAAAWQRTLNPMLEKFAHEELDTYIMCA